MIVIEITGCLPFTKIFQKIRLESNWHTTFWVVPLKISGSNGTSEKVVLFFRTEYSKRNFASHFVKAIFDTGFRPSRPFFLVINAIPGRNLRVLNFVYHLPRPRTDRFAHVNGLFFVQISSYSRVYVRFIYKRKANGKRVKFLWDLLYKLKRSSANVLPVYVARCMTSWKQARSMSLDLNKRIASLRIPRNLIFWFVTEINLEASRRKRLTACGGRPLDQALSSRLRFSKANF